MLGVLHNFKNEQAMEGATKGGCAIMHCWRCSWERFIDFTVAKPYLREEQTHHEALGRDGVLCTMYQNHWLKGPAESEPQALVIQTPLASGLPEKYLWALFPGGF